MAVIPLDRTLWHAGGIQMMGRILAVPLYGKMPDGRPRSHVRFYDFSVPTRPTEIREMRITRPKKAFAVALAGLPDKRTLAIVWDDKTLDFYYSRTPGAKKWKPAIEVPGKRIPKFHQKDQKQYQCINLVVDSSSKDFFLVGFHNTNKLSPLSTDYFRPG